MREEKNSFEKLCWERRGENRPAGASGRGYSRREIHEHVGMLMGMIP